jgi:hypothetical protein
LQDSEFLLLNYHYHRLTWSPSPITLHITLHKQIQHAALEKYWWHARARVFIYSFILDKRTSKERNVATFMNPPIAGVAEERIWWLCLGVEPGTTPVLPPPVPQGAT